MTRRTVMEVYSIVIQRAQNTREGAKRMKPTNREESEMQQQYHAIANELYTVAAMLEETEEINPAITT